MTGVQTCALPISSPANAEANAREIVGKLSISIVKDRPTSAVGTIAGPQLVGAYRDWENSIRGRTPVAGQNIAVQYLDGSAIISVTGTLGGAGEPFPLIICSNGTPSVVTVLRAT